MGGIALHQGNIAHMMTGQGKTLVSTLAVYLNAIKREGIRPEIRLTIHVCNALNIPRNVF